MHTLTLKELSKKLHAREISSVELTKHFLNRIKTLDPKLNSFITVCESEALQDASNADKRLEAGEGKALTGIPIAHKDLLCTKGLKTSCASKMLDNFIAPYDATLVAKLKNAGTVLLGKLNMDEFAMGSSNETSFYGPCKNPWNLDYVPGGSSGGSVSAMAARLVSAATGTDTGGSIRQPAAFSNVTGLKPTYGRVSRYGLIAFASSLDQAGSITQTAEDAAILLNAMAGFDEKDSTSFDLEVPDFTANLHNSLKGLRIGIPKEYFPETLDSEIAQMTLKAAKKLESLGATLVDVSLPNAHLAIAAYYVIAPAEASSNLARFDGVRYGYRCENPKDLQDLYERTRAEGFGDEVKHRILIGTYVLSSGYYNAYYNKACQIRTLIAQDHQKAFEKVDVILGPTAPSAAFALGSKKEDRVDMYLSDIYTVPASLAGLPALSMPAGFKNQLPVGVQLTGNYFEEARILNVAHRFQMETNYHKQIPALFL